MLCLSRMEFDFPRGLQRSRLAASSLLMGGDGSVGLSLSL